MLGKTNMDEFAMGSSNEHSAYGPGQQPVGPRDRARRQSAAAPRSRSPPITRRSSIGTDTGGSIRQPAALTGIVGLKPTYGRVSRYGIVAFASSLDQIGPFARDVRDAAALLHAIAGRDERDSTSAPVPVPDELLHLPAGDDEAAAGLRGKRLGLPKEYFVAGMEPDVAAPDRGGRRGPRGRRRDRRGGQPAAHRLRPRDVLHRRAGGGVGEPRPLRRDPVRAAARRRRRPRQLPRDARPRLRARGEAPDHARHVRPVSAGYYDAFYVKAQKVRTLIKRDFDTLFEQGFDALVAPTSPSVAFRFGAKMADPVAMYLSDACTLPVNMAGLPGISIPCGLSEGMPVGLQLIGPAWSEARLFGLARAYEALTRDADWRDQEPAQLGLTTDPSQPTPAERAAVARRPLTRASLRTGRLQWHRP